MSALSIKAASMWVEGSISTSHIDTAPTTWVEGNISTSRVVQS
eukprot:CAMPEP_0172478246 /NCGR_PEP_ID=MMETSP1066-20121228/2053_1 /TAXON_ID=671091 /ORGANISM="Coscinodiscus wailesii, Strain CCMP2513" /LENGTH=42 /DNA_ID= /DNA_START= /DNA_END= /DNA_ORIENTATION=